MDANIGKVFGRLTVKEKTSIKSKYHYTCLCECGNSKEVSIWNLTKLFSPTLSCGCFRNEKVLEACGTHLLTNSKEYKSWSKVKERTTNPNTHNFCDYGEKGWRSSLKLAERRSNMPNIVSLIKALFQRYVYLSEDDKETVQRMIDQSNAVQTQEGSYEQAK